MGARIDRSLAALAAALALAVAAGGACSSDGTATSPGETFMVHAEGDRFDLVIGAGDSGRFRFEARGFPAAALPAGCDATPTFFLLHDGTPDPMASLFRYQLMQGRSAQTCAGIAVRGYRPEYPGNVFQEGCSPLVWDRAHWYAFEVAWDHGTIETRVDGALVFSGDYFGTEAPLIASLGWPPATGCGSTGIVGLEYRAWEVEKP